LELFDYLDEPDHPPCDHTLKATRKFLAGNKLPVRSTVKWLKANGGYCDCEVMLNTWMRWIDWAEEGQPDDEDEEDGEEPDMPR